MARADDKRTLAYWLGQTARTIREEVGVSPEFVADILGISGNTVRRFEKATNHLSRTDELLAVYAKFAGLDDARDVYALAVAKWQKNGEAPKAPPRLAAFAQIAELRMAERALRESLPDPGASRTAPKRSSVRSSRSAKPAA